MLHFVFDTCSILNIIKIDDDLELIKQLRKLKTYFPEKVFEEAKKFLKTNNEKSTDYKRIATFLKK